MLVFISLYKVFHAMLRAGKRVGILMVVVVGEQPSCGYASSAFSSSTTGHHQMGTQSTQRPRYPFQASQLNFFHHQKNAKQDNEERPKLNQVLVTGRF